MSVTEHLCHPSIISVTCLTVCHRSPLGHRHLPHRHPMWCFSTLVSRSVNPGTWRTSEWPSLDWSTCSRYGQQVTVEGESDQWSVWCVTGGSCHDELCKIFDVTLNCCSQHYLWSLSSQLCLLPTGQFGKFR